SFSETTGHKNGIAKSHTDANRLATIARQQLSSCAAQIRQEVEAEKAQALATLVERENTLRARYALEIGIANSAFRRVWQAAKLFGKSIDDEGWSMWRPPLGLVA